MLIGYLGNIDTIKSRLAGRKTMTVGTLIDKEQEGVHISISLRPDVSQPGNYSVVLKSTEGSQSIRMFYSSNSLLSTIMHDFEEYMNIDDPGRYKVLLIPSPSKSLEPLKPTKAQTQVDIWKQELKKYNRKQFKTFTEEQHIKHLKTLINADANKFSVGDGVGWRVTANQINRGYRIIRLDRPNKMSEIAVVADTGLTVTGGDKDKLPNRIVPVGDLVRDKQYDAKPIVEIVTRPTPPQIIPYSPSLRVANIEALPRGLGAKFLVVIPGQKGEWIAKQWKRKIPQTLNPLEALIDFQPPLKKVKPPPPTQPKPRRPSSTPEDIQLVLFGATPFMCYHKATKKGFRAYCRRK